jgi:glucans biosynthesis protein C
MAEEAKITSSLNSNAPGVRLYFLDWLRVLSMAAVFLYHNNRLFNYGDWHVKNAQLSLNSTIIENAFTVWVMPLIFAISGAAVYFSTKSRTGSGFVTERLLRLGVPLLIPGVFIFGPLQIYLERFSHGSFTGNFWQFLPHYFEGLYGFGGNFAWMGVHLWYLMLLLVFTLLFLPILLPSRKTGTSLITKIAPFFNSVWGLLLLSVPLMLTPHLTDALGMGFTRQMGGWDIFSYMLFFIYGYLLFAEPGIIDILRKYGFIFLGVAAAMTAFGLTMVYAILPGPDSGFFFSSELHSLNSWLWILGFTGLAGRYLNSSSGSLSYANEAVLPFYILHQPIVLSIGYFVVQSGLPVIAKYCITATSSLVVIMLVYETVRRTNPLRFLFGMRTLKPGKKTEMAFEKAG